MKLSSSEAPESPSQDSRLAAQGWAYRVEYAVCVAICVGVVASGVHAVWRTSTDDATLARTRHRLSPPWLQTEAVTGVDFSDGQLGSFVRNGPLLLTSMVAYVSISWLARRYAPSWLRSTHLLLNMAFVVFLHRASVLFMMTIFLLNFLWSRLSRRLPFWVYYGVAWAAHVALLFCNDIYNGYRFAWVSPRLAWLDAHGGLLRWHVGFNMSTLRMVGFLYDVYEANNAPNRQSHASMDVNMDERPAAVDIGVGENHPLSTNTPQPPPPPHCADCVEFDAPCYRARTATPRAPHEYNFTAYLAYLTYAPLFVGGPLTSFNAYRSHLEQPQRSFDLVRCVTYGLRTCGLFVALVVLLHVNHLCALRSDGVAVEQMPVGEKLQYGLLFLAFLWLKFNVMWKTFRLFGLLDGIESPEDMNRCFANTTSIAEFWRDWHASFNIWIVRYMYVPMGGSRYKYFTIVPIFMFIAVWHDIQLHLLWWAGIVILAFIPEVIVMSHVGRRWPWLNPVAGPWWRRLCAVGCTVSMLNLIIANLFGFGLGMRSGDSVTSLAGSASAIIATFMFLFAGSTIALHDRLTTAEATVRRDRRLAVGQRK